MGENVSEAFLKHVFLGEIEHQTRIAGWAAERLTDDENQFDPMEIWSAIQLVLTAAGNVSKILWPPRKSSAPRGAMLRELLDIDDDNPLFDRNIRNHFEHYDERIEDWFATKKSAVYVDQSIGPPTAIRASYPENVHRSYDPSTQTLAFRGEEMDLSSILIALNEIRQRSHSIVQL